MARLSLDHRQSPVPATRRVEVPHFRCLLYNLPSAPCLAIEPAELPEIPLPIKGFSIKWFSEVVFRFLIFFLFLSAVHLRIDSFGRRGNMEENGGLLKVIIVKGRKLAIRDFTSSDPYVVVRVGNHTAKTKVINSCLNPVWNEELTFSAKEPLGVLKLEVFDKDRFKSDDKMGHTFLDLRPLASASKLKRALQLTTDETMLRKVAANSDNCLLVDTSVVYVNGEIVLDARLKLRDVESGELYVTVRWIDHPTTTTTVEKA